MQAYNTESHQSDQLKSIVSFFISASLAVVSVIIQKIQFKVIQRDDVTIDTGNLQG